MASTTFPTGLRRPRREARPGTPVADLDLYSDTVIEDSRDAFARIRDAGRVVWLPCHRMWAIGRFDDVRAALRDDELLVSGEGVAVNPLTNRLARLTTLVSDDEVHDARRKVLMRSLGAKALAPIAGQLDAEADAVVQRLVGAGEFDVVGDFSRQLPVRVVAGLVGVHADPDQLLRWAASSFDALGPLNPRGLRAGPTGIGLLLHTRRLRRSQVAPGSWASTVFDAADRGEITRAEARTMIIDFVAPSLDTTILAATTMLWLLGQNPDEWDRIRADPGLIPAAVVEAVRIASPIRGFTRRMAREGEVAGTVLPAGARVVLLFGAANLDPQRFPEPERFDLDRAAPAHLGWGNGAHACVGLHLAKLELTALLRALVNHARSVQVGTPVRLRNNTLQGIARLSARLD